MRIALVLAFVFASAAQAAPRLDTLMDAPLAAPLPELPRFQLSSPTLDIHAGTPSLIVPPRFSWVVDDGRAFWFSAGASSVVTLGTHVLVGTPTLVVVSTGAAALGSVAPAVTVPVLLGAGAAYMLVQCALSSLASYLVFNGMSKVYDASYIVSLAAHVAGTLLGAGVSALVFGVGFALIGGLNALAPFTGSAGVQAVAVFSVLGALPAVVIGGIALVGVPALVGSWGMAVSATPKDGFTIDPGWRQPAPRLSAARDPQTLPLVSFAL